jgi:hypothetical protein
MASTQTSFVNDAIGITANTIFTANNTTALVGVQIANISNSAITVDLYVTRSASNYYLVKGATVAVGGALAAIGGDVKHFLVINDALKVVSSAANSAHALTSVAVGV